MTHGLPTSLLILTGAGVFGWLGRRQLGQFAAFTVRGQKIVLVLIWLIALVPMIQLTSLVVCYGVNIPMLDDWEMAPLIVKAHTGQLQWVDIFQQQQEARTILSKLIFILSAQKHWDVRDQMMLSVISCGLTAAGIFVLLRRSGLNLGAVAICFWLAVLTIFSTAQYELWIFASGFPSFLTALFLVASLFAVGSQLSTGWKFFICAALATASSFNLPSGLLAWGLTFPALLIGQHVARWRFWLGLWLISAAVCGTIYFWGYAKPAYLPQFAPPVSSLEYLRFVLTFLGSGVANSVTQNRTTMAAAFGLLQLLIFLGALLYTALRIRDRAFVATVTPWVALGIYSLGCACLAALGRIGFGAEYGGASRYVTFAHYLTIAVIVLVAILSRDIGLRGQPTRERRWVPAICLVLCLAYLVPYALARPNNLYFLGRYSAETRLARGAVLFSPAFDTSPVIQKIAYPPGPDRAIRNAAALDELKLLRPLLVRTNRLNSLRHESADGKRVAGSCETITAEGEFYHASGWALLKAKGRPPDCIVIAYETPGAEPIVFAMSDSIEMRWDIARHSWPNDYLWAGWRAKFRRSAIPAGAKLSFWAVDADGPALYRLSDESPLLSSRETPAPQASRR